MYLRALRSLSLLTVGAWTAPAGQAEHVKSAVPPKADDRTIVHVLNRLGFGAAPGDVERVRTMGLAAYIDQQLQPERIDDAA